MNIEMTKDQSVACKAWLATATYENEFRPLGMEALAKLLKKEHEVQTSSSALGRWRTKFGWQDMLEVQIATALTENEDLKKIVDKSIIAEGSKKIFDDFNANESIKNRSYILVEKQLKYYETQMIKNEKLSDKDMKITVELLKLTSDRKDKMLDRQAISAALNRFTMDDVVKRIESKSVDVDVDNGYDILEVEVEVDE